MSNKLIATIIKNVTMEILKDWIRKGVTYGLYTIKPKIFNMNTVIYEQSNVLHWCVEIAQAKSVKGSVIKCGRKKNKYLLPLGVYIFKYNSNIVVLNSRYNVENVTEIVSRTTTKIKEMDILIFGDNIDDLYSQMIDYKPNREGIQLYKYSSKGYNTSIDYSGIILGKDINNIFIDDKQVIIDFLDNFINNNQYYTNHDMIYKTGILLYGEPGTGKTSLIKAIAKYIGYNLLIVDNPFRLDNSFCNALAQDDLNLIIVLEDIDRFMKDDASSDDENEETKSKDCIGNLLNILDGINSPSNVIFIATTNYKEKLDPVIFRPGRFDLIHEVKPIHNRKIAEDMCRFFDQDPKNILDEIEYPYNQSKLQNKLISMRNK